MTAPLNLTIDGALFVVEPHPHDDCPTCGEVARSVDAETSQLECANGHHWDETSEKEERK